MSNYIHIKGIIENDFINYKEPSMTIQMPMCSFKCDRECGQQVCQNGSLHLAPTHKIKNEDIIRRYLTNPITSAIVFQGLEPFDSWEELLELILDFRDSTNDDIVIYTGYTEDECADFIDILRHIKNIIIKFGRFIPDKPSIYEPVLEVMLASPNQYAKKIS